jgi:hypothetical protein
MEEYKGFFEKGLLAIEETYRDFVSYKRSKISGDIHDALRIFALNIEGLRLKEKNFEERAAYKEGWDAFQREYADRLAVAERGIDAFIEMAFITDLSEYGGVDG